MELWGFKLTRSDCPTFLAPPIGETMRQTPQNNAFCAGRIYGPHERVTGTYYPNVRAVNTADTYGYQKCTRT